MTSPRPLRILAVDDDEACRMGIRIALGRTPHALTLVTNGQEAVDAVRAGDFDLVLMDLNMPVLDGAEAARAIRAWEKDAGRPALPIVALTAGNEPEDERRCLEAGFTRRVSKPLRLPDLVALVNGYA